MDMGIMELSMGLPDLFKGRVMKGFGGSSQAPCWLGGILWLLIRLPVSNTVSSPGALGYQSVLRARKGYDKLLRPSSLKDSNKLRIVFVTSS